MRNILVVTIVCTCLIEKGSKRTASRMGMNKVPLQLASVSGMSLAEGDLKLEAERPAAPTPDSRFIIFDALFLIS